MVSASSPRVGKGFGKYQIVALLGKGGMGEVYEARDTEKGRSVALKILLDQFSKDDDFRRRFTREAHAAAQLQEPHVIPIHDWGEIDGSLYIDMRLVRGIDLRRLLRDGPFDPPRAVAVLTQVAAALDAAHADDLMHRDVKPENIVVTADDFAYLVDFGIASRTGDSRLTQTGMTVGSLAYIAPERLTDQPTTAAADIYSLTCVLYEMLTGQGPFDSTSAQQLLTNHLYTTPPRPSSANYAVPASFDEVVARGMAKEPGQRYRSAGELARAASRALSGPTAPTYGSDATLAAQQVLPVTDAYTQVAPTAPHGVTQPTYWLGQQQPPPHQPPQLPQQQYPQPQPQQPNQSKSWAVPVIIAVCAALLLAVVGVAVVVLTNQEPEGTSTSSNRSTGANPDDSNPDDSSVTSEPDTTSTTTGTTTTTTRPLALPPIVRGLDANQESCDDGIAYNNQSGPGTRSARGSTETTCFFARNVLYAYWEGGAPTSAPRTVYAAGSVNCQSTAGRCMGDKFIMDCSTIAGDDWITCTGGSNARVYIY